MTNDMIKIKKLMNNKKVFSRDKFLLLFNNDLSIGSEIINAYKIEFIKIHKNMIKALSSNDYQLLNDLSHELKGVSSYVTADSVGWICEAIMSNIKKSDKRLIKSFVDLLSYEHELWLKEIDQLSV